MTGLTGFIESSKVKSGEDLRRLKIAVWVRKAYYRKGKKDRCHLKLSRVIKK